MPSNRQKALGFVKKFGKFCHIEAKGLISPNNSLDERFKRMTLMGTGTPAHKHIEGGTMKYHNRPYQLKIVQKQHQDPHDILLQFISNYNYIMI